MKRPFLLLLILFFQLSLSAQEPLEVETEIKGDNIFELSIIKVFPDSFPLVSVVFQAKNKLGKPLWKLEKDELSITENNEACDVLRIINITENKPLNIGLVFDHSGSMIENPSQTPDSIKEMKNWSMQDWYYSGTPLPDGYVMSIEYAKEGVLGFLSETENSNDSILFTGFSSEVDYILPLTNDVSAIKSFVANVEPGGMTSFYDAIYLTIDSLSKKSNKGAVVALTDGQDNQSLKKYQEVIDYGIEMNIPIYIIGLGNVNEYPLMKIAEKTNGLYYYTNDPKTLKEIYLNIKEQLRAIYQVDYSSFTEKYAQEEQSIRFQFVNDTLQFNNSYSYYELPGEAIAYLKEQEEKRLSEFRTNVLLPIGIGSITLLGIGGFILYRRRKKNKILLKKVYPNPFINEIEIEFLLSRGILNPTLNVYDSNGIKVKSEPIVSGNTSLKTNLEDLKIGMYVVDITSDGNKSNPIKIIKN